MNFQSGDAVIAPCGPGQVIDPYSGRTAELSSVGHQEPFLVYSVLMEDGEIKRFAESALAAA